jgi:hypothetical protein
MTNGFFGSEEWDDALHIDLGGDIDLFAKQDLSYLYIGIRTGKVVHTGLDLYLAASEEMQTLLHVSSALAQASHNQEWSDWLWEQNNSWVSNKIGLYHDGSNQCSSEPEGFEFQIHKDMIQSNVIHLALHLKRPEREIPSARDREAFINWIQLRIDR